MNASHILVPIDFSAGSLRALEDAVDLNRTLGARLEVLFVVETARRLAAGISLQLLIDRQHLIAAERLEKLEHDYAARSISLTTSLEQGNPAEVICAIARKRKSDMIVMATHGATGLLQTVLGSVSEHVVRAASCPVLTIHTYVPPSKTRRRSKS